MRRSRVHWGVVRAGLSVCLSACLVGACLVGAGGGVAGGVDLYGLSLCDSVFAGIGHLNICMVAHRQAVIQSWKADLILSWNRADVRWLFL